MTLHTGRDLFGIFLLSWLLLECYVNVDATLFAATTAKRRYLTTTEPVQNALLTFVSTVVGSFVVETF
jgi:hypothetical protein